MFCVFVSASCIHIIINDINNKKKNICMLTPWSTPMGDHMYIYIYHIFDILSISIYKIISSFWPSIWSPDLGPWKPPWATQFVSQASDKFAGLSVDDDVEARNQLIADLLKPTGSDGWTVKNCMLSQEYRLADMQHEQALWVPRQPLWAAESMNSSRSTMNSSRSIVFWERWCLSLGNPGVRLTFWTWWDMVGLPWITNC